MEVEQLTMPQEEATKQVQALKQLFKQNKSIKQQQIYQDMRKVYGHMHHGGKVIDIYQAFKGTGLDEDNNPKIAIARADATKVHLWKQANGGAIFTSKNDRWNPGKARKTLGDIQIPSGIFEWEYNHPEHRHRTYIKNPAVSTIAPLIPAQILIDEVKHNLKNYFILWEVEEWKPEPPVDPILLKQLTPNLFGVLATWDLTEIERSIIRSHILREDNP